MANREVAAVRRVVIVSPDAQVIGELEPLLERQTSGPKPARVQSYPSPRDLRQIVTDGSPHTIFLDASSDRDQAAHLLEQLVRLGQHVQIIALLGGNDPDLILRCLRMGAVDFLIRPFTADQIDAAAGKLSRVPASTEGPGKEPSKIFVVMPAKGACGATTIASNLAYQWKRLGAKRILLADLDPLTGNLSFLLKIKSIYSFMDTLHRSHELDQDLWGSMVTHVNGVDVLLAPELITEGAGDLLDPSPILDYARHIYDVVIVDAGSVYGEWNLNLARLAGELLLVTTNELPALQAAQRAMSYLDSNRVGRWKIRLIVNRYQKDVGLSREVIGTALHADVFETLPNDYEAVQKALLDGRPIPSNTVLGKAMVQFANRFGSAQETVKKSSSLGGLLGLFSKTSK